jgi:murein DD-endopeptidase MepM/ murein hydrolase activator NlpD
MYGSAGCREVSGTKRGSLKTTLVRLVLGCLFLLLHLVASPVQAQTKSKNKKPASTKKVTTTKKPATTTKDFKTIKAPEIKAPAPMPAPQAAETQEVIEEELSPEFKDKVSSSSPVFFQPKKELSIVSEDTSTINEGELNIVEVAEHLKIDCVWVKLTEYYAIWDSKRVNPYQIDNAAFKDTISLTLYDSIKDLHWSMPLDKTYPTSKFGMRGYRWHYGIDLKLDVGDTIRAAFDGIVRIKSYDPRGYGYYVMLRHYNGLETLYGHMSEQKVEVGQVVKAGELIGLGGSTGRSSGPHLHYEVRYQGNAINPEEVYDFVHNVLQSDEFTLTQNNFSYITKAARKSIYHKIRPGETLSSISRKYGVPINTICRNNKISTKTKLMVGRSLRIK